MEGIVESSGAGNCPVCLLPLLDVSKGKSKAKSRTRGKSKCKRSKKKCTKHKNLKNNGLDDEDIVLVTECGHLYHKLCLIEYAQNFKKVTGQTFSDCPQCTKKIIVSRATIVDLSAHNGFTETAEKEYRHGLFMNGELRDQIKVTHDKIHKVEKHLSDWQRTFQRVKAEYCEIKEGLEARKSKYSTIQQLKANKWQTKETILILKRENLQLTSVFIYLGAEYNEAFGHVEEKHLIRIPSQLMPHIVIIQETPHILEKFTQILFPIPVPLDNNIDNEFNQAPTKEEAIQEVLAEIKKVELTRPRIRSFLTGNTTEDINIMISRAIKESEEKVTPKSNIEKAKSVFDLLSVYVREIQSVEVLMSNENSENFEDFSTNEKIIHDFEQYSNTLKAWSLPVTACEEMEATEHMLCISGFKENVDSSVWKNSTKDYFSRIVKCHGLNEDGMYDLEDSNQNTEYNSTDKENIIQCSALQTKKQKAMSAPVTKFKHVNPIKNIDHTKNVKNLTANKCCKKNMDETIWETYEDVNIKSEESDRTIFNASGDSGSDSEATNHHLDKIVHKRFTHTTKPDKPNMTELYKCNIMCPKCLNLNSDVTLVKATGSLGFEVDHVLVGEHFHANNYSINDWNNLTVNSTEGFYDNNQNSNEKFVNVQETCTQVNKNLVFPGESLGFISKRNERITQTDEDSDIYNVCEIHTCDSMSSFDEHETPEVSCWTKYYPPIEFEVFPNEVQDNVEEYHGFPDISVPCKLLTNEDIEELLCELPPPIEFA